MTLAELKRLKTFRVKKTFSGTYHAGNHAELKESILQAMDTAGIPRDKLEENDNYFVLGNRTWYKPKILKEDYGTVTMRSKDYFFVSDTTGVKSFGSEIKATDTLANGFRCKCYDGSHIDYEIIG